MLLQCLFVFVATLALDFLWARYILAITKRAPVVAALWSAGIIAISSTTTIVYVSNHWTILAAIVGAFIGTYLSVREEAKKEDKQ
jgi:hypothetical protein